MSYHTKGATGQWTTEGCGVFRVANCSSVTVLQETSMHPRLEELLSDRGTLCKMKGADFFPRVRDKGEIDRDFDLLFPKAAFSAPLMRFGRPPLHINREETINDSELRELYDSEFRELLNSFATWRLRHESSSILPRHQLQDPAEGEKQPPPSQCHIS